ncbi:leucine-rich repeat-containing protein 4B [Aphelenchoides avenae]|nr:leucine-rich repeat-containing protein 4B [Aphelenchus avenae]
MKVVLVLLTLSQLATVAFGILCPPGCTCSDESRSVTCVNAKVLTIPILLHPSLQSLTLVNTSLLGLDKDAISIYRELRYLSLARNAITEIPTGFFDELVHLEEVHMQENRLRSIDNQTFVQLTRLRKLDLSRNEISRLVPNSFVSNPGLRSLNLSENQLHFVSPNVFSGLKTLEVLDLSRNRFSRLESRFFEAMPALRWVSLRENMISQVPFGVFSTCAHLLHLDLSSNVITTIQSAAFSGMPQLKNLTLARNMLSIVMDPNWSYLPALERLDLSWNGLPELSSLFFDGLHSLKELNLANMADLARVEAGAFAGLTNLETLSLSGCPMLQGIDEHAFEHPTRLRHLDLRNNQLTSLGLDLLDWRQLKSLQIAGNPWNCSCDLLRLVQPLLRTMDQTDAQAAICSSPEDMLNRSVANARSPFCTPITEYALGLLAIGVLLVLFSVTLVVVFCLRSRRQGGCLTSGSPETSNFRVPLYTAGSSFTDSLSYGKSAHLNDSVGARSRSMPTNAMVENSSDYYSSILLLPHSATSAGHSLPQSMSPFANASCPYVVADPPYLYHQRPPSFIAPPPPPTVPPPQFVPRIEPVSV